MAQQAQQQVSSKLTIPDLLTQIDDAVARVATAAAAEQEAVAEHNAALNALNALQSAVDQRLTQIKKAAPARSEWSRA